MSAPGEGAPAAEAAPARRAAGRTVVSAALAIAWAGVLFWASSQPNPFPELPHALLSEDKLLHGGAYAVLGALVRVALGGRLRGSAALGVVGAVAAAYGASDEWHQSFVPHRSPDVLDWLADVLGAVIGAVAAAALLRRRGAAG